MKYRKASYYKHGRGRSFNAAIAEAEGRLPRTRAARVLGLSVRAFDTGCRVAGYRATEWHHVGKYAARIDYYDTAVLASSPEFWQGAASAYRAKTKIAKLIQRAKIEEEMSQKAEARQLLLEAKFRVLTLFAAVSEVARHMELVRLGKVTYLPVPAGCEITGRAWAALNESGDRIIDVRSMRCAIGDFLEYRRLTKEALAYLGTVVSGTVTKGYFTFARPENNLHQF